MFLDWLDPLLTRASRAVRAMGYLHEINGIHKRYERCKDAWAEHVGRSRAIIRRAIERCPQRRKAIILGAGLLYDIHLEELAATFREVVLVDLVHPFHSRWGSRHLPNVRRQSGDITGTIEQVYQLAWEAHLPLPRSRPQLFLDDPEVDFTASMNLLSHLPCVPMAYLTKEGAQTQEKIDAFARHLIEAHLEYLARQPGVVALITDV